MNPEHWVRVGHLSMNSFLFEYTYISRSGLPWWHDESACSAEDVQEMWVQSLGQEDTLDEGIATHSSILAGKIRWTESLEAIVHRVAKSQTLLKTHMHAHTCTRARAHTHTHTSRYRHLSRPTFDPCLFI